MSVRSEAFDPLFYDDDVGVCRIMPKRSTGTFNNVANPTTLKSSDLIRL